MQNITDYIEEARTGSACTLSEDCLLIHCSNSYLLNLTLVPCSSPPVLMINLGIEFCSFMSSCRLTLNPTFNDTAEGNLKQPGHSSPLIGFRATLDELEGAIGLKVSVA